MIRIIKILFLQPLLGFKLLKNKYFLYKLKKMLNSSNDSPPIFTLVPPASKSRKPISILICLHLFYEDLAEEFIHRLSRLDYDFTLAITMINKNNEILQKFEELDRCKRLIFVQTINKGRDIAPFFKILKSVELASFDAVCKIHSKKSPHNPHGNEWRDELLSGLLSNQMIKNIEKIISSDKQFGVLGLSSSLLGKKECYTNAEWVYKYLHKMNYRFNDVPFFSGTMLWISPHSLEKLKEFEKENFFYSRASKYTPNNLPEHAMERVFGCQTINNGFNIYSLD